MLESKFIEKQLIHSLRKENVCRMDDQAALNLLKKVRVLSQKGKGMEAATHYAALAAVIEQNAPLALHAARSYHKANDLDAAARWYLITAERYAHAMKTSQAVAALRVYRQLKPENKRIPQRIYDFCLQHGSGLENPPSILLGPADFAGSRLRESGFFKFSKNAYFDQFLKQLTYHKLQDGEHLRNMNSKASVLYMIISGSVSGYLTLQNKRMYLGNIGDDNLCGEIAYFTHVKHTEELVSQGVTEVFEIPYVVLDRYRAHFPSFNQSIHSIYQSRILTQQLALTRLFQSETAQQLHWVAAKMKPVAIEKDSVLMREGEAGFSLYLLCHGKLVVSVNVDKKERLLKILEGNSIVGEIAIMTNQKRTATVTAITDCVLMKLDAEYYQACCHQSQSIQAILKKIKEKHTLESTSLSKRNITDYDSGTDDTLMKAVWQSYGKCD
ncbi:MAG: cyclic nucleotide-binding domain-containing protein [Ghiorsea sp.]|nr:cyclic nucleotide-binding domain-containing protein [Ghiorsea sp.]